MRGALARHGIPHDTRGQKRHAASHRSGGFVGERYRTHVLKTPREVRHSIAYVLLNHKKHGIRLTGLDPMSSTSLFDGFVSAVAHERPPNSPTQLARTWLLSRGWRRHGLLRLCESPAVREKPRVTYAKARSPVSRSFHMTCITKSFDPNAGLTLSRRAIPTRDAQKDYKSKTKLW